MNIEDIFYPLLNTYKKGPAPLQKMVGRVYRCVPNQILLGKKYKEFKSLLERSEVWSGSELYEYQNKEFLKTIKSARQTAFYPRFYKENGIDINKISSLKQITELPFITKKHLQENGEEMVTNKMKGLHITTGGSTGVSVGFYLEKGVTRPKELAFMEAQWSRMGYKKGDKCAVLRGEVINSEALVENVHKMDHLRNWLQLSSYHLIDGHFSKYIEVLNEFKPKYIQAYPSAIFMLSKYINNNNVQLTFTPKAILAGSENIYDYQTLHIEKAFNTRVYSWYGHSERLILGGYCEDRKIYHLFPQYGVTEVIDQNDTVITQGVGELIGTGFHNTVMPLIRYKTADICSLLADQTCSCGRNYMMIDKIEGREQEMIITKTNRKISLTALNMHSSVFSKIKQFQFLQEEKGSLNYTYIPFSTIQKKDLELIKKELKEKLGSDVLLRLTEVESIPLTSSGKQRALIKTME